MSLHVFGNILTGYGCAANNRGETEGNITTLQKLLWKGQVHTVVSAEAIRWALRYYWQTSGLDSQINRSWDDIKNDHSFKDQNYQAWHPTNPTGKSFLDDDLLGFMDASAGNEESEMMFEIPRRRTELQLQVENAKNKEKSQQALTKFEKAITSLVEARGKLGDAIQEGDEIKIKKLEDNIEKIRKQAGLKSLAIVRRGVLEVSRAISTTPYAGDISFNARSGVKSRTSLYGTEMHATRYQYGFCMTPERLKIKARCLAALDAISSLGEVAGNHSRFLFDFSPESIILRISNDPAPRILYCLADNNGKINAEELARKVKAGDIDKDELIVGGAIAELPEIKDMGVQAVFGGIKEAVKKAQEIIKEKLGLKDESNQG
ncbi:MAG: DevR family CRISPR-associated autoregulator [Proteobacteria bacterium]|nr:DevR family CRISPR-associated autoregulator [Pseudomonadota bacterium]MBU4295158.1 DevR family CRISPR-associated autoregulator [Pseudomonadota bacterium]MCG2749060.1 DevR family CRISPR-associated autoregulator [Desulfobulbaceae bacterium]